MANEYGEIEQLVNDVTSLDTARMTLRWALERLNSIEKEKAELKKNLTITEEAARTLQIKEASLRESFDSRYKTLEEKEDFYSKLEATMALLGEGKLDIQQLLKKEAKLDILRKSLEAEYQGKFEELDHNQRAVIGRWNSRLLETEAQYAARLAEAQKKYDALRAELEGDYQKRLSSLQASFCGREAELTSRIAALETSAREREGKTEARRGELEAQYLAQQREAEVNYRKLKNMLEAGLEEKIRAMDSDHCAQVRSLEESWQTERSRLLEEQRIRDAQFVVAQDRIKEIENNLAAQQAAHHGELLKMIAETEAAFHAQLLDLEKEKKSKEERVRELLVRLETRNSGWEEERARLEAQYGGRVSVIEAAARERAAALERDYSVKKEELNAALASGREGFEREFQSRMELERRALEGEKANLSVEKALREAALAEAAKRVQQLEAALAVSNEEHHKELLERISSGERDFREKLACFEAEKTAYNITINNLTDELRAREAILIEEKNRLAAEFEAKAANYESRARQSEAAFEEQRSAYNEKVSEFSARLNGAAEAALIERETFKSEIARVATEAQALAEKRIAAVRVEYDTRKVELEKEFVARYGDRLRAIEAEKERMNETLEERDLQLKEAYATAAKTDAELAKLRKAATDEQHALGIEYDAKLRIAVKAAGEEAGIREGELKAAVKALHAEVAERERLLADERTKLISELEKASEEARVKSAERVEEVRLEYAARLTELQASADASAAELKGLLEQKEAQMELAAEERAEAEKYLKSVFEQEKNLWRAEKEALALDFERRQLKSEAGMAEYISEARADVDSRKAELEQEYSSRKTELESKFSEYTAAWHSRQEADYNSRESAWKMERDRLIDAVAARDEQLKSGQDKIRALQGDLETQFSAMETAAEEKYSRLECEFEKFKQTRIKDLEESWAKQRSGFAKELSKRDALVQRISEEMVALREGLAQASAQKAQNSEEVIQLRAMDVKLREKCSKLEQGMENLQEETRQEKEEWRKNTEKQQRALNDERDREKAGLVLYYQEKMDKLVEACEKYNKEIEAREAAVARKGGNNPS